MKKSLITATLLATALYSQSINIHNGWQLLGATEDLNTTAFDNSGCVDYLWKYDATNSASPWSVHISNGISYNGSLAIFNQIKEGSGFWVKGNSNCQINTTSTIGAILFNSFSNKHISFGTGSGDWYLKYDGSLIHDPAQGNDSNIPGKWSITANDELELNLNGHFVGSFKFTVIPPVLNTSFTVTKGVDSDGPKTGDIGTLTVFEPIAGGITTQTETNTTTSSFTKEYLQGKSFYIPINGKIYIMKFENGKRKIYDENGG